MWGHHTLLHTDLYPNVRCRRMRSTCFSAWLVLPWLSSTAIFRSETSVYYNRATGTWSNFTWDWDYVQTMKPVSHVQNEPVNTSQVSNTLGSCNLQLIGWLRIYDYHVRQASKCGSRSPYSWAKRRDDPRVVRKLLFRKASSLNDPAGTGGPPGSSWQALQRTVRATCFLELIYVHLSKLMEADVGMSEYGAYKGHGNPINGVEWQPSRISNQLTLGTATSHEPLISLFGILAYRSYMEFG